MNKEICVHLSPSDRGANRSSLSPFDEIRAQRDQYYTSMHEERSHNTTDSLAKDLQELDFNGCCAVSADTQRGNRYSRPVAEDDGRTRQAASVTRASDAFTVAAAAAVSLSLPRPRPTRTPSTSRCETSARADRLATLRSQLKQYLDRDATPHAPTPTETAMPPSPSYDPDIRLSESPHDVAVPPRRLIDSSPTPSSPSHVKPKEGLGASPLPRLGVCTEDIRSEARPLLHYPADTREPSIALFVNTPSPSPEAARTAPRPHFDSSHSRSKASVPSTQQQCESHSPRGTSPCSVGYTSPSRSTSADAAPPKSNAAPRNLEQNICCAVCLVEDTVVLSHPCEGPQIRFCPFCGSDMRVSCSSS